MSATIVKYLAKLAGQDVLKTVKAVTDILPLITTDISPMDMTLRIFSSASVLTYGNDQMRLPVDDMYTSETVHGQDALVPDFDANIKELQKFIYG